MVAKQWTWIAEKPSNAVSSPNVFYHQTRYLRGDAMPPSLKPQVCDVLVIGGGINGAGIARDAAGRGLTTVLCEKDDLASHTSSASTKLIHGGLRYLEQYDFVLVRKALMEREILLRAAPHLIWPLQFVMPHDSSQRPAWMIRAGLLLYDCLARRELLPASRGLDLHKHVAGTVLKPSYRRGFSYADGWVDDARLVILNAVDAADRGATILTRTACIALQRNALDWHATLRSSEGVERTVQARAIVNATGPWASRFSTQIAQLRPSVRTRLIKGSHIVVRKLFDHTCAYLFQNSDGRIVFAIPYEQHFTLIGTTDVEHDEALDTIAVSPAEVTYLCTAVSRYFSKPVLPADVVWAYAGVRPLQEEVVAEGASEAAARPTSASRVTRDYQLAIDVSAAPLINVFGGKLTTYRKLAEETVSRLGPLLANAAGPWTASACLPGGDLYGAAPSNRAVLEFEAWVTRLRERHSWLAPTLAARYARAYGTRVERLLAGCTSMAALGEEILPGLFAAEVRYLMQAEWARCAADILWRRSKLGLHLDAQAAARLDAWIVAQEEMVT